MFQRFLGVFMSYELVRNGLMTKNTRKRLLYRVVLTE